MKQELVAAGPQESPYQWPLRTAIASVVATSMFVRMQGRLWWCDCNQLTLWSGDANGPHNSQHLLDPYAFTHVEHGFLLFGILAWVAPRLGHTWRFCLATVIECLWELLENSSLVIERFRAATAAQGYSGDTVANVFGDVVACAFGFWLASRLGLRRTIVLAVIFELVLLLSIRDCLLLNIIMLIWPNEAIKHWQLS